MADPKDLRMAEAMARDPEVARARRELFARSLDYRYSYNFSWFGRPVIQYPEDLIALQEIVFRTKPDLIVETGVAHGGSLIYYASLLELLGEDRTVLGIDIEIRADNRKAIEEHQLAHRIDLIEGSSTDPTVVGQVAARTEAARSVLVVLDSNHTSDHVAEELRLYSPLVKKGGYLVVLDTIIEQLDVDAFPDRPWGQGDSPATAVESFLATTTRFEVDPEFDSKLLLSVAPGGYLRCVQDT